MMPKRIQRRRSKGWKMPEGAIYVGRPTKSGNPVKVSRLLSEESAKNLYSYLVWPHEEGEKDLDNREKFYLRVARARWKPVSLEQIISELRGKDLVCWCHLCSTHKDGKPFNIVCSNCTPCHADILGEIANS